MSAEPGFQQLLPMREAGRLARRRPGLAEWGGPYPEAQSPGAPQKQN